VKVGRHSTNAASRLDFFAQEPEYSRYSGPSAHRQPGASLVSMLRRTFTTDCYIERIEMRVHGLTSKRARAAALSAVALLCCLLVSTSRVNAQGAAPKATTRPEQKLTFPVATQLVQVSVVVHDKNGAPVRGLTAADFELFDKGKEQTIETFSMEAESETAPPALPESGPQRQFNNLTKVQGGVTVILLDRLNTAWEHQNFAKNEIVKYLRQIQPSDKVGLYVLESNHVRVLHDFTTDAASLLRSLDRHKTRTSGELEASMERAVETGDTEMDVFLAETNRIVNAQFLKARAENTCEALIAIADHLAPIRGRKNLIWVSSVFPMTFDDPIARGSAATLSAGTVESDVQRATRALSESAIAVYPVDARGLIGAFNVAPASLPATADSGRTARGNFATLDTVYFTTDAAKTIAENTGGRAYDNTNDLGNAIRRAVDDSRVTYLIGYSPNHGEWNGRFREIKVKSKRPGLEVRHRRGYLALPPTDTPRGKIGQAVNQALENPLQTSVIAVGVRIQPVQGSPGDFNLTIRFDPRPITLEPKGENWEGTVALAVAQTNAAGKVFKSFDGNIELPLTKAMKDKLLSEGMSINKLLSLRDDANQVHIVVGDPKSLALGSVVISAEKVRATRQ
jgi:VWFA-related protein